MARTRATTHSRVPQVLSSREEFAEFLRQETTGGFLLLGATLIALVWANVAGGTYREVRDAQLGFGPSWLHLNHLSAGALVADGLLAVCWPVSGSPSAC
ncbi:Na+/H+ antiporter NhaA [Frankia sp. Cas3]|uniref:Na+/H+ antiporter NhaA n=1 Tax=Frankia sp. Cas3 TaxID=3073926 RepID=UPI002AD39B91|nr:Na+/H+ antiporter NhaA [Frankia sp. Cas3]